MENKLRSEAEQQAHEHSCKLLLNCYIRELALEKESDIRINPNTLSYTVTFQASRVKVTGRLSYYSAIGEHEYLSMESGGEAVHYHDLVRWITSELSGNGEQGASLDQRGMLKSAVEMKSSLELENIHPLGENTNRVEGAYARDFAQKVDNSVRNLTLYIEQAAGLDIHDYRTSEQSLLVGHPFHPFPKNSKGFSEQDVQKYSPELRTSFQLCYIAVRQDVYMQEWVDDEAAMDLHDLLRSHMEPILKGKSEMYGLLPVHPWQYAYISRLSEVQHYIRDEKLILLGSAGPTVYPTSSVRTVYIPAWNCNIKLSLNMQITNMIRTNSAEQMRRTLDASRYVRQHDCFGAEPNTHIAYETGVATCAFEDEELTSLFTIAYRPVEFDVENTYVLSSLVEAPLPGMRSGLMTMLGGGRDIAERWMDRYLACSLLPIVRAAGEKGIHFEAHLQNTLVTLEDGLPVDFIVRDLEGVSVDEELIREQDRAASDLLFYSREKAWARTSYYFIVNHLGSLIHAMARDVNVPEEHFWKQVREVLVEELERTGNAYVKHLLTTEAFLAKQNLVSCLRGISQTPVYVPVSNPMKRIGVKCVGVVGYRAEAGGRTEAVYVDVQERIMRQTLEAMWFEGILDSDVSGSEWRTSGLTSSGDSVAYTCEAERKFSFGRVKVKKGSIQREGVPCTDLDLFLEEIVLNSLKGANVTAFIQELLETMAKDSQCRAILPLNIPREDRHYDALESHMTDGHLYHPSYKSRLGFSLKDNLAYGPEFNSEVALVWVAVKKELAQIAVSAGYSSEELVRQHLTAEDVQRFHQMLEGDGKEASDAGDRYVFIPAHPWQWEHQLESVYARQLMDGDVVYLGPSSSPYRAQQSIRSLSNRINPEAPYIKLALSITNTSSTRILAQHTTQNAPLISDWLDNLVREDELLQQAQFGILKEIMGLSFRYEQLPATQYGRAYGTLGAIWRENVSVHLQEGETAWPLNALMLVQADGVPFIQDAVERHGVEKWSDALVHTVTLPIIHLLYAHGIALESHAQNIMLVLEDDLPKRIIIKDLHDGVRYVPDQLLHPERAPKLNPEPETHRKFNRYSFIYAGDVSEVRDYTYDAFFFICMTDIALAFEKFGLSEQSFWQLCAGVIVNYQKQHPEYAERFVAFDLFAEDALIEEMTKRRLYGDGELYFRKASNPLKVSKDALESQGTLELKGIIE